MVDVELSPKTRSFAPAATFARVRLRNILPGLTPVTRMGDRPLSLQSRERLPLSPTVWADFGAFLMQKTKLPRLATVC